MALQCIFCVDTFLETSDQLFNHLLKTHNEEGKVCAFCQRFFCPESKYESHIALHKSSRKGYIQCLHCNYACLSKVTSMEHAAKHCQESNQNKRVRSLRKVPKDQEFIEFQNVEGNFKNGFTLLSIACQYIMKKDGVDSFKCLDCKKQLNNIDEFLSHKEECKKNKNKSNEGVNSFIKDNLLFDMSEDSSMNSSNIFALQDNSANMIQNQLSEKEVNLEHNISLLEDSDEQVKRRSEITVPTKSDTQTYITTDDDPIAEFLRIPVKSFIKSIEDNQKEKAKQTTSCKTSPKTVTTNVKPKNVRTAYTRVSNNVQTTKNDNNYQTEQMYLKEVQTLEIFSCNICKQIFSTEHFLNQHKIVHLKYMKQNKYPCKYCTLRRFSKVTDLIDHVTRTHKTAKFYMCDICSTPYGKQTYFSRHIQDCHSDVEGQFGFDKDSGLIVFKIKQTPENTNNDSLEDTNELDDTNKTSVNEENTLPTVNNENFDDSVQIIENSIEDSTPILDESFSETINSEKDQEPELINENQEIHVESTENVDCSVIQTESIDSNDHQNQELGMNDNNNQIIELDDMDDLKQTEEYLDDEYELLTVSGFQEHDDSDNGLESPQHNKQKNRKRSKTTRNRKKRSPQTSKKKSKSPKKQNALANDLNNSLKKTVSNVVIKVKNPNEINEELYKKNPEINLKYRCHFCSKRFRANLAFHLHIKTHFQEDSFLCFCGVRLASKELFEEHKEKYHNKSAVGDIVLIKLNEESYRFVQQKSGSTLQGTLKKVDFPSENPLTFNKIPETTEYMGDVIMKRLDTEFDFLKILDNRKPPKTCIKIKHIKSEDDALPNQNTVQLTKAGEGIKPLSKPFVVKSTYIGPDFDSHMYGGVTNVTKLSRKRSQSNFFLNYEKCSMPTEMDYEFPAVENSKGKSAKRFKSMSADDENFNKDVVLVSANPLAHLMNKQTILSKTSKTKKKVLDYEAIIKKNLAGLMVKNKKKK